MPTSLAVLFSAPLILVSSMLMTAIQPKFEDMKSWQIIFMSFLITVVNAVILLARGYIGPLPF